MNYIISNDKIDCSQPLSLWDSNEMGTRQWNIVSKPTNSLNIKYIFNSSKYNKKNQKITTFIKIKSTSLHFKNKLTTKTKILWLKVKYYDINCRLSCLQW